MYGRCRRRLPPPLTQFVCQGQQLFQGAAFCTLLACAFASIAAITCSFTHRVGLACCDHTRPGLLHHTHPELPSPCLPQQNSNPNRYAFHSGASADLHLGGSPEGGGQFPLAPLSRLTCLVLAGSTGAHPGLGRPLNSYIGANPPSLAGIGIGEGLAGLPQLRELHMDGLVQAVPAGGRFVAGMGPARATCRLDGAACCTKASVHTAGVYALGRVLLFPHHGKALYTGAKPCLPSRVQACPCSPLHPLCPLPLADLWQCTSLSRLVVRSAVDSGADEMWAELPPLDGARLPHLRALCLRGCAAPTSLAPSIVAAAPQLTALALGDLEFWSDGAGGSGNAMGLAQLAKLTALQELDLSSFYVRLCA